VDPKKEEPQDPASQDEQDEDKDHEHDEDPEAVKGNYQGDLQGDIEELFPKNDAPKNPPKGKPILTPNLQSFGSVDNGELVNGINLLTYTKTHDGLGFYLLHPNTRKTYFGNNELVLMIRLLGRHTQVYVPSHRLGIGDMSAEKGGQLVRHSSHQMGADVDITYFISNDTRPKAFEKLVDPKGKVNPNLMIKDQWRLFKYAVSSQWVDRIFVHPSIKKALCQLAEKEGDNNSDKDMFGPNETLRRLRPESNHGDHFHLRVKMRCIKGDRRCQPMGAPPSGTGCDKV
jgi:penicillin-insensitive murein endopeptidase